MADLIHGSIGGSFAGALSHVTGFSRPDCVGAGGDQLHFRALAASFLVYCRQVSGGFRPCGLVAGGAGWFLLLGPVALIVTFNDKDLHSVFN
jgi:hypothetical protein